MHFKITIFTYKKWSRKKKKFFSWPLFEKIVGGKQLLYICVWFSTKIFSMCHGTYSPIPDPSKNWSVKGSEAQKTKTTQTFMNVAIWRKKVYLTQVCTKGFYKCKNISRKKVWLLSNYQFVWINLHKWIIDLAKFP